MTARTLAAAAVLLLAAAPPARADEPPQPVGDYCGWVLERGIDANREQAVLYGGPIASVADGAATVTLRCSVQEGMRHQDPDLASVSATGTGAAVLPPTVVTYPSWAIYDVSICSELTVTSPAGTRTLYRDHYTDAWTTDPLAYCDNTTYVCPTTTTRSHDDCGEPPYEVVDGVFREVDRVVCPAFAFAFPPDGDIEGIWDCPPYES